jgi:uncharacterized RmlC-like cupin family protein
MVLEDVMKPATTSTCVLIDGSPHYHGKQGLDYFSGVVPKQRGRAGCASTW